MALLRCQQHSCDRSPVLKSWQYWNPWGSLRHSGFSMSAPGRIISLIPRPWVESSSKILLTNYLTHMTKFPLGRGAIMHIWCGGQSRHSLRQRVEVTWVKRRRLHIFVCPPYPLSFRAVPDPQNRELWITVTFRKSKRIRKFMSFPGFSGKRLRFLAL